MIPIYSHRQMFLKTLTLLFIILVGVHSCRACLSQDEVRRRRSSKQPEGVATKSSPETRVTVITTRLPSLQSSTNSSANSTDGRPKRQLFREDIPMHRPLTGNHYANFHGFPHPGRWTGRESGSSEFPPTHEIHGFVPQSDELSELPPPSGHGNDVGPHYKVHGHGNEVVHEYPIQVSPVISLSGSGQGHLGGPPPHDVHAPPKVHPDQDPERPYVVGHGSNPHHPPDIIIKELNGEPGPTGPEVKHVNNHHGNHGSDSYEHQGHHYGGKPYVAYGPPYTTGAHRIAHFLKTWPIIFHKMRLFPFRRYRKRIKHPYPPPPYHG